MEIKVIKKVFDILELAAQHRHETLLPGEIAEELQMPTSTCVRLLKLLTSYGYLEQLSRRKGYRLGPLSYYLGQGEKYQPELVAGGENILEPLSQELKISVQLATRHENFLMILCGFDGDPTLRFNYNYPRYYALHLSVTGRMLLSHAPETERRAIVTAWSAVERGPFAGLSAEEILAELDKISRRDEFQEIHNGKNALAIPIKQNGQVFAVLGAVWRVNDDQRQTSNIREKLHQAANQITDIISYKEIF